MIVPWTKPYYKDLTLAAMAEFRIAREYHVLHYKRLEMDFEDCIHEVCEDSRELIGQLEYQARLMTDCEIFVGPETWKKLSGKAPVT